MKYNPEKHDRRSRRLQGYDYSSAGIYFITICTYQRQCLLGEIAEGEMQLNEYGQIARSYWLKLPRYHSHLQLDAFVVMPNHIHGILVLSDNSVGAGFDSDSVAHTDKLPAKPAPTPGFDVNPMDHTDELLAKPAPTHLSAATNRHGIPEIIRGFKTFSARYINQRRKMRGVPLWQRNYYEHIIRNDASLQLIRQYIHNNPSSWQEDQLHPDCSSKW